MKYAADVEGKARETFDDLDSVIDYAASHVLASRETRDYIKSELLKFNHVSWSYGFKTATISKVS